LLGNEVDPLVMTTLARITVIGLIEMGTRWKFETR